MAHVTSDTDAGLRPGMGKVRLCRYFGTKSGCHAGENCAFLHNPSRLPENVQIEMQDPVVPSTSTAAGEVDSGRVTRSRQAVTNSPASRIVPKPIPRAQAQDPREFQLGQMRRRFSPKESRLSGNENTEDSTVLEFNMSPSDPDFPFEMDTLQCLLVVPMSYPGPEATSRPKLKVKNKEIPRGFAINVERGFDELVTERKDATLLMLMSALDKNLEKFLSEKKAETVKLFANADTRHLAALSVRSTVSPLEPPSVQKDIAGPPPVVVHSKPAEVFTTAQKTEAQQRRVLETRQLEARLGRLPFFKKSGDGIAYTLPIEPRKSSELPLPLRDVKTIQLFVPLLYPLECCRIQLEGVKLEDAKSTEKAFEENAKKMKDMSLMGHLNYLAQNLHILARAVPKPEFETQGPVGQKQGTTPTAPSIPQTTMTKNSEDDRSHIKIIPRPPEWTMIDSSDLSDTDDDYSYDFEDGSGEGRVELPPSAAETAQEPEKNPERGTALSFPFIELYGIELLEVTNLNLTVKCERCKDTTNIHNLKTNTPKAESCKKCATVLKVCFRRDLIHANAVRAGFLDLEACTIVDMLPSTFIPTCSTCSTPYPAPGIISVRGETATNVCRECHAKFTFKISSVKFLRITSAAALPPSSGPRRKRETLGLVTGTELPDRGRCKHYSKSYRWFRFSCCDKVYPCDRCHDEKEEHPNEHANRMICGWCSREQSYRPEECAWCGKGVVGGKSSGFWEGGKGTRDRVRMSRKDGRKYKRIGGEAKAKAKAKAKD